MNKSFEIISVACFGAIRPMKNTLIQAMAAIVFAKKINKILHFHINKRCEQNGDAAYKNLTWLFKNGPNQLIEHCWVNHSEFLSLVKKMDIGMQVSFSETFNIVAADFVSQDIPLVGSKEIEWLSPFSKVSNPTNLNEIVWMLLLSYYGKRIRLQYLNKIKLDLYNSKAIASWVKLLHI